MGRLLDRSASGPVHLRRKEIAELVIQALQDGQHKFQRYQLHSFVVMPNHVHLLVTPKVMASRWLANEFLASHGQAFWQDESYDHRVRSPAEFDRIRVERSKPPERRLRPGLAAPHFVTR
ncbi:MAG TPA: hypothetical protein VMH28_28405 [Candidatus Acidoferrales bacterium]|nr:hypothetical protein [Candidatus Acidoferrales bacterium]